MNYGENFLVVGRKAGTQLRVRVPSMDVPVLRRGEECGVEWAPARIHVMER